MATTSDHVIRLRADLANFERSFSRAERRVGRFTRSIARVPGFTGIGAGLSAAGLTMAANRMVQNIAEIRNVSRRLGIDPEVMQRLRYVADQTGVSVEEMVKILEKFEKQFGTGRGMEAFQTMGRRIAAGEAPPEGLRKALGEESYGKFLQAARQDIQTLMEQAPVLSTALVEETARLADEMTHLSNQLAVTAGPALLETMKFANNLFKAPKEIGQLTESMGAVKGAGLYASSIADRFLEVLHLPGRRIVAKLEQIAFNTQRTTAALTEE